MNEFPSYLRKRACEGDHCPVNIPTWKIIVYSMIPLMLISVGIIYIFGVRHMQKVRKREAAEDRFDALEWGDDDDAHVGSSSTQRVNSFYSNQKPGYARSATASSFSTVTPVTAQPSHKTSADDLKNPFNYQMQEYTNSMVSVPVVKDASYILPPNGDGDNWGYEDPVTQRPDRAHSPSSYSGRKQRTQGRN